MARRKFSPEDQEKVSDNEANDDGFVGPPLPDADHDLTLTPPPMRPSDAVPLEERLRRVEEALSRLASMQEPIKPEQAVGTQVTTQPGSPSVLSRAVALVESGRQLLPGLSLRSEQTPSAGPSTSRWGLLREMFVELQAIYFMSVDPRYRKSWFGRIVPLVLLALFVTSSWWLTFVACGVLTFIDPVVKLVIGYVLFKVLGAEAKRYRETAPDLPTNLRA